MAICLKTPLADPNSAYLENTLQEKKFLEIYHLFRDGHFIPVYHLAFYNNGSGLGWDPTILEMLKRNQLNYSYNLDRSELEDFKNWYSIFAHSNIESEAAIARALGRLERSYNNLDIYENVTEVVIGLEALFSEQAQSEITHKIAERLALFITDVPIERLEIMKNFKAAYNVRSGLLHTSERKANPQELLFTACQGYLRTSIRKIIEAEDKLKNEFCNGKVNNENKTKFFEHLIAYGTFQDALNTWKTWLDNKDKDKETINNKPKKSQK